MSKRKVSKWILITAIIVVAAIGIYKLKKTVGGNSWSGTKDNSTVQLPTSTVQLPLPSPTPTTPQPQPSTSTPPPPSTPTSRGTFVYTVVDSKEKVHTAFKESADIRVVGFVGRAKAIVEVSEKGKAALEANPRITFAGVPGKTFNDVQLRAGELTVVPLRTEDLELIERVVKENGGKVKGRCGVEENPDLRIVATDETIAALMELPEARWIENYEMPVFFNYNGARKIAVNGCWPTSAGDDCGTTGLGLTGEGQLVTTCDSGIDTGDMETMHPSLKPNLIGFARTYSGETLAYGRNKHGTHTAGSIVGTGAMSSTVLKDSATQTYYAEGDLRGIAYGAKLWAWFGGYYTGSGILPRDSIGENFRPTNQKSYNDYCAANGIVANIFSGSYGGGSSGSYTSGSRSIDDYCWRNPDFLPCFAAGNYYGSCKLSDPASAKNTLTVGASENEAVAGYGSKGPTKDERIKPDVVAPGSVCSCNTVGSADGPVQLTENYYRSDAGTSMSTPLTAGTCALVREWLVKYRGFNETNKKPSSALVRAILMGGAIKLTTTDSETGKTTNVAASAQGAGRVNLSSSIAPEDGRSVYLADRIQFGEGCKTIFTFRITEPKPFDAQLAWVDYPGTTDSDQTAPKLVNDLDLELYTSDTSCTYGRGDDGATNEPDQLNNAEKIHMAFLPQGTYKLVVNCANVPHSSLEGGAAALYVKGAFDPDAVEVKRIGPPILKITVR